MDDRYEKLGIKPPPPALPVVHQQVLPPTSGDVDLTNVKELAKEHTATAIQTLVYIAQYGKTEAARVAAATAILERGHGKTPQGAIEVGDGPSKIRVEWV